ncbi:ABC-ATPase domain-containing protein [Corynebacterium terpenotabidum]|uniref:ATPase of the ABC class n=1 Tax=Corynebacterium terpenotabidum Y-11 TaxID=1200352 RepID=S4XCW6_9CORY|nr:ABC-ATPase domain-containing protein [Corynebacterium terpenotabidum]AGP30431.1 hypothetical protein A606_03910 [Corynebacterium terpenotabidum Y-11]
MTLDQLLRDLDGAGYGAYRKLTGRTFPVGDARDDLQLTVEHVQADPFAPPSAIRVDLPLRYTGIPNGLLADPIPVSDHLLRRLADAIARRHPSGGKSTGHLQIDTPGPEILDRSAVTVRHGEHGDTLRVRLQAALPAHGRRINGRAAAQLLCGTLPDVLGDALLDLTEDLLTPLREHVECWRDQEFLRHRLPDLGLVAFLADGAVLPRRSGDSQRPLDSAVPLTTPESRKVAIDLPSGRTVVGLGVGEGVTLIVGGGYHGKSTLLKALERGVYDHIPGDGRELCVTVADATTLRAEDGRAVTGVDISPFLHDLPSGTDTRSFSTTNASGSTSQAAALVEACEAGASCLLIDEDTSATNFMIRDARMRALVPAAKEPITPLVDRVRALYRDHGVSTVLVAGGSGAFLDVADTVIMLDAYRPIDVTDRARALAEPFPAAASFPLTDGRTPTSRFQSRQRKNRPPQAKDRGTIRVGDGEIDLSACAQLVDTSQTRAIAAILPLLDTESGTFTDRAQRIHDRICADGWDALPRVTGNLALPRVQEITAAVNRWRGLSV